MVLRPLSKRDKEIKAAVLRGESAIVIARNKRMSRAAVYRVIDELVYRKSSTSSQGPSARDATSI